MESQGHMMVQVPANTDSGIQGPTYWCFFKFIVQVRPHLVEEVFKDWDQMLLWLVFSTRKDLCFVPSTLKPVLFDQVEDLSKPVVEEVGAFSYPFLLISKTGNTEWIL